MRLASAAQSSHVVVKLNTETKTSRRLYTTGPCLHITSEVFFSTFSPDAHGARRAATTRSSVARSHPNARRAFCQSHRRRIVTRLDGRVVVGGGGDGGALGAVVICTQSREDCRGVYATCTQDREGREGRVEKSLKVELGERGRGFSIGRRHDLGSV